MSVYVRMLTDFVLGLNSSPNLSDVNRPMATGADYARPLENNEGTLFQSLHSPQSH